MITGIDNDKLLLTTANNLRVLLNLYIQGNFGDLPADTGNELVNMMARQDNALGAHTQVGK